MIVFSLIGRGLVVFALCIAVGLHWVALQSIAWTAMFATNAKQTSLAQAVAKTFDGAHPCDLCKGINAAQHSQKKPEAQSTTNKLDLICTARLLRIISPSQDFHYPQDQLRITERKQSPPVPPPRVVFA